MASEVAEIGLMTDNLKLIDRQAEPLDLLIERAVAGDRRAFDQIMVCHQQAVVATAWRMLGNREDARDAAQEAFLRVYKYLKNFKPGEDFQAWLYRITVNVCHDLARKRRPARQHVSFEREQEDAGLASLSSGDDVEAEAMLSQEKRIVAKALATLSKKERTALVLRDLEGLSTEEVAEILGSSPATVRSQISSARAKIKKFRDALLKGRAGRGYP